MNKAKSILNDEARKLKYKAGQKHKEADKLDEEAVEVQKEADKL